MPIINNSVIDGDVIGGSSGSGPSITTTFYSNGLSLASITQVGPSTFKLSYTFDPLEVSATGAFDALNPSNYALTGPVVAFVQSSNIVGGDTASVFLTTNIPLPTGTWTITVSNVKTAGGATLVAPTFLIFNTVLTATDPSPTPGSENDNAESLLRKFLNPALAGPGWDALIAGMASGDQFVFDTAQAAFDQMFRSTASGKYLDRRASDYGFVRPANVGVSDEIFRQLAIEIGAEKLTLNSFLSVLEIFYGIDATRATVDSIGETYTLQDGDDLILNIDGQTINIFFHTQNFRFIDAATASEVASVITAAFELNSINAYAVPVLSFTEQANVIRIYSGAIGYRGRIQIVGGRAQNKLQFPTLVPTTQAISTQWQIDIPATMPSLVANRARYTWIGGTNPSLQFIRIGDYANIYGSIFNSSNIGAYPIVNITTTYFEVVNPTALAQTATQLNANDVLFFRPTLFTLNSKSRVSAAVESDLETVQILLPDTTQAVNRGIGTGAYLNTTDGFTIAPAFSLAAGALTRTLATVTVTTPTAHHLITGDTVYVSPGETNFPGGVYTITLTGPTSFTYTDAISATASSTISENVTPNYRVGNVVQLTTTTNHGLQANKWIITENLKALNGTPNGTGFATLTGTETKSFGAFTKLSNGQIFSVGGNTSNYYVQDPNTGAIVANGSIPYTLQYGAAVTLNNGQVLIVDGAVSGAARALIYDPISQSIVTIAAPSFKRQGHSATLLKDGRVLVVGGANTSSVYQITPEIFNPANYTWTSLPNNISNHAQHSATLLNDGRVLIAGGSTAFPGSFTTAICELYNPINNTWAQTGSMNTPREQHQAVLVNLGTSGKVMAIGGLNGTDYTGPSHCEMFEPSTQTWSYVSFIPTSIYPLGEKNASALVMSDGRVLLTGGGTNTDTNNAGIYSPLQDSWTNVGPLNFTNATHASFLNADNTIFITAGTDSTAAQLYTEGIKPFTAGGLNKLTSINSVPQANILTYVTPDFPYTTTIGSTNGLENIIPLAASSNVAWPGPYVFDPKSSGPAITGISTTITNKINQSSTITLLTVANTTNFPSSGYLCFGFGGPLQTFPVKYIAVVSPTQLLLDSSFTFPLSLPAGTVVNYLPQRGFYVSPTPTTIGSFYLTDSISGRIAAQNIISSIAAVGANITQTIIYSSDRGLGNEGYPVTETTDGNTKVSDKVFVWGIQQDLKDARGF